MQKINTTSSCQAELVAPSKSLQQSIFLSNFLTSHGYPPMPVKVSQDNTSTIPTSELLFCSFLFYSLRGKIMSASLLYPIDKQVHTIKKKIKTKNITTIFFYVFSHAHTIQTPTFGFAAGCRSTGTSKLMSKSGGSVANTRRCRE